jgi:hypothetical protein
MLVFEDEFELKPAGLGFGLGLEVIPDSVSDDNGLNPGPGSTAPFGY